MQILEWGREALHKLVNYYVGTTIIDATTLISYISKKVGGGGLQLLIQFGYHKFEM